MGNDLTLLRWGTLTKTRFDQLDRSRFGVLLTCSPMEVHGPHLPLGADALQGEAIARRMLEHLPDRHRERTFLELPFLYTATDTLPQPGSLYFHPTTIVSVLTDLGRSLAAQGFRDLIVSNFHGSPRHFLAIEKACDRVTRERGVRMVALFSILLSRLRGGASALYGALGAAPGASADDFAGDTHAGIVETSQLLALHPEWVERTYAQLPRLRIQQWLAERMGNCPYVELGQSAGIPTIIRSLRGMLRFFREETYAGAPRSASAELGERILDTLGSFAAEAVSAILEDKLPPEKWHSPLWPQRFLFVNPLMIWLFDRLFSVSRGIA